MAHVTRRGFVKRAAAGAAALGALAAPELAGRVVAEARATAIPHDAVRGPLVAHVRNVATGEVALLVGTREIVIRDHELVRRLVRAVR